jgi:hypothetical protein
MSVNKKVTVPVGASAALPLLAAFSVTFSLLAFSLAEEHPPTFFGMLPENFPSLR